MGETIVTIAALQRFMTQKGVPNERAREIIRGVERHGSNGRIICEMRCCIPADVLSGFLKHIDNGDEQLRMLTGDIGF